MAKAVAKQGRQPGGDRFQMHAVSGPSSPEELAIAMQVTANTIEATLGRRVLHFLTFSPRDGDPFVILVSVDQQDALPAQPGPTTPGIPGSNP